MAMSLVMEVITRVRPGSVINPEAPHRFRGIPTPIVISISIKAQLKMLKKLKEAVNHL